jgi:hypothetical protein
VLYKKSSATENWHILDNKRDTLNPNSFGIDPNTTGAEANDANLQMDFLSNGFKLRTSHGSGNIHHSICRIMQVVQHISTWHLQNSHSTLRHININSRHSEVDIQDDKKL